MKSSLFTWLLRIVVAVLFLQTLYFKFTASSESVYIFSKLGMEPYGRIGSGIFELIAAILVLIPRTVLVGALLGLAVISGAILSHLFVLGIEVQNDGGLLFILALTIFICCAILIYQYKSKIPNLLKLKF
ncbi:MAG: hypothetical protein RLZZ540_479 [Bacteroidota bacterium]|jgi:uncharacterized membrane protein YphA (DoxX/SURF4 family)